MITGFYVKKRARLKVKAESELSTATACRQMVEGKLKNLSEKNAKTEKDIAEITQNIRKMAELTGKQDSAEIRQMATEIKSKNKALGFNQTIYKQMKNIYDAIEDLELRMEGCITLGWYRYVIRVIPEHKILRGIESENGEDFELVLVLIATIVKKIMDRVEADESRKKVFEETMKEINRRTGVTDSVLTAVSEEDDILKGIFGEAELPTDAALPVTDTETNDADREIRA